MNLRTTFLGVGLSVAAFGLLAQDPSTSKTTTQTTQNPDGSTTVTVTGEVVRYEPGRTIVIRQPNSTMVTYTLGPSLVVPTDVAVGRRVTITTEPGEGSVRVQRITTVTTTSTGEPEVSTTERSTMTEETQSTAPTSGQTTTVQTQATRSTEVQPSGQTTTRTSQTTMISGTVSGYEPGQSITIVGPNKKTTTYTITQESQLPQDIAVGKRVTVTTTMVSGKPVVRSVTSKTTTKTTHTRTVSPQ